MADEDTLNERDAKLVQWLNEAYAKEAELEADLTAHIALTQKASYKKRLRAHLTETKRPQAQGRRRGSRSSAAARRPPGRQVPGVPGGRSARSPARRSPRSRARSAPPAPRSPPRRRRICATPRRSSARSTSRSRSTPGSRPSPPRWGTRTPRSWREGDPPRRGADGEVPRRRAQPPGQGRRARRGSARPARRTTAPALDQRAIASPSSVGSARVGVVLERRALPVGLVLEPEQRHPVARARRRRARAAAAARGPRRGSSRSSGSGSSRSSGSGSSRSSGSGSSRSRASSSRSRSARRARAARAAAPPHASALPAQLPDQQVDRPLEVLERSLLDARDPELAVEPRVDLPVTRAVAAANLGDQPVALVAQPRPALERRQRGGASASSPLGRRRRPARRRSATPAPGPAGAGPNSVICGATSALSGTNAGVSLRSVSVRSGGSSKPPRPRPGAAARGGAPARRSRRGRAGPGRPGRTASSAPPARPGIVRTNRPTICRNTSGVLAAVAYTPTRSRGMSTPSETMFTATIHGSLERVNSASLAAARGSACRTTTGLRPVASLSSAAIRRACAESAAITSPPASAMARAARSSRRRASASRRMRGRPSGQLGGDRGPVATARLAAGEHGVEPGLDHVVAAAPGERAVVGDERHRPAHPVAHRLGVGVGDIGLGQPGRGRSGRPGSARRRSGTACRRAAASGRWRGTPGRRTRPRRDPRRGGGPRRRRPASPAPIARAQAPGDLAIRA